MIRINKQYRTKCGYEVRIYAVDGKRPYPIHGAYFFDGEWILCRWAADGACWGDTDLYLIEVKPRIQRERWVNIYEHTEGALHEARHSADFEEASGADRRIACVKIIIDCEEGEGL